VTENATFWFGCNVLRHGDIIRACIDMLRLVGIEPAPVGGPDYCCGSIKNNNPLAADGMAKRTVEKMNAKKNARLIAWCPSCYSQMNDIMSNGYRTEFDMDFLVEVLHERRDQLKQHFVNAIPMTVLVHRHVGFEEKVPVNRMVPDLLSLIPGMVVVEDDYRAPGYMCNALAAVPQAMNAMLDRTRELVREHKVDAIVTVFHQCYRDLCGLETQGLCDVFNYIQLLSRSLGIERPDDYKSWKHAGAGASSVIGEQRIEFMGGADIYEKLVLPELLKLPGTGRSK